MCALSELVQSNLGWPMLDLDFAVSNEQNYYREDQTANSLESLLFASPPSISQIFNDDKNNNLADYDGSYGGNQRSDRKLCHNASERDRRKKLNSLYSSLRSLLPASDQRKKLSIAMTVARVVKYIPELQQELERLSKKRDEIQRKVWRQGNDLAEEEKTRRKVERDDCVPGISVTRFSDKDFGIQISAMEGIPLSDVLMGLEEFGLCLMGASSFVSSTRKVFYNLHFEMEGNGQLNCEELTDRLLFLYDKKDELLPQAQAPQVWT